MIARNNTIHGLRGLFAIGVLLSHCSFTKGFQIWSWIKPLSNVSFFFMLSGFFLFLTYKKTTVISFIKKKLKRLYPLHFCLLLLMILVKIISHSFVISIENVGAVLAHLFLVQTWVPLLSVATSYNTVSWFLSSLFFCYIIGFGLISWRNTSCTRWGIFTTRILIVSLLGLKVLVAILLPRDNELGYYLTYLCPLAALPDFLIGFEIAEIYNKTEMKENQRIVLQIIAVLSIVVMFVTKPLFPSNYTRSFYTIPFNILILIAFSRETKLSSVVFGNDVMLFIGSISFEIYLIHDILITTFNKYIPIIPNLCSISPLVAILFVVIISAVCAIVYQKVYGFALNHLSKKRGTNNGENKN